MKEGKWLLLKDQEDGVKQFKILGEVGQLYLTVSNLRTERMESKKQT